MTKKGGCVYYPLKPFLIKTDNTPIPKIINNTIIKNTWNLMTKGCQNGAENDADTHHKSMPKQVSKQIRTIIKNHISLNGEIMEFHGKNKCFWRFSRLRAQTEKVSNKQQKWYQNPIRNQWQIHVKFMLEEVMQQAWQNNINWAKKGTNIHPKLRTIKVRETMQKINAFAQWPGGVGGAGRPF